MPPSTDAYHGPAGVMFTPTELISIYVLLVGSNRPDHVAIRAKITRYLAERVSPSRGDNG